MFIQPRATYSAFPHTNRPHNSTSDSKQRHGNETKKLWQMKTYRITMSFSCISFGCMITSPGLSTLVFQVCFLVFQVRFLFFCLVICIASFSQHMPKIYIFTVGYRDWWATMCRMQCHYTVISLPGFNLYIIQIFGHSTDVTLLLMTIASTRHKDMIVMPTPVSLSDRISVNL